MICCFTWNMWRKSSHIYAVGKRENVSIAFSGNYGHFSLIIYQNLTSTLYRLMAVWSWNCINELFILCCIKVHCYILYFACMYSFTYSLGLYVCVHLTSIFFLILWINLYPSMICNIKYWSFGNHQLSELHKPSKCLYITLYNIKKYQFFNIITDFIKKCF